MTTSKMCKQIKEYCTNTPCWDCPIGNYDGDCYKLPPKIVESIYLTLVDYGYIKKSQRK